MKHSPTAIVMHPTTRELRELPIEGFYPLCVTVRWDLSGLYEIDLRTGVMIAQSRTAKARKKAHFHWRCQNLPEIREIIAAKNERDLEATRKAMVHHAVSMPRGPVSVVAGIVVSANDTIEVKEKEG